ncbi:hypothetical protein EZV62_027222 [Acer yangbiense]|uniref:Uncharacterized protein n=1 Tax=Acer yangbiense TaxID=1000413 RepID=A0A5C7GT74_9ROSI|nr:hypothetical protein EZV62_027222 [Acer yangbiense]
MALSSAFRERLEQMEHTRNERLSLLQAEKEAQANKSQMLSSKLAIIRSIEQSCLLIDQKIATQNFKIASLKSEIEKLDVKVLKSEVEELEEMEREKENYYRLKGFEMNEFLENVGEFVREHRLRVEELRNNKKKVLEIRVVVWKYMSRKVLSKETTIGERPTEIIDDGEWNKIDGNAIANLHLAQSDGVLLSVAEKKTAKEIWDTLTKSYEAKSLQRKIFLKRRLYTLRMAESSSVTDHCNTLNTLFSQLTMLGHKIDENEHAELLLERHVKSECWLNKKSGGNKAPESSNSQGCVASTSDDGEVLYSKATSIVEGRKQFADV